MRVQGRPQRTIERVGDAISIIDQTKLPHVFERVTLKTAREAAHAIETMMVRGAPLIGVTGAYGVALALQEDPNSLAAACEMLVRTRPTAVNLRWAIDRMKEKVTNAREAWEEAARIAEDDVETCLGIGRAGASLVEDGMNILTHCNAGWLATVDYGTALAPIYVAHDSGKRVHVWVSETRPRNQGASLTAWELGAHGVPHTIVSDNACGHLIARGKVDFCIVGADRVTARGDVANKVGTYLKALACARAKIPFCVAFPHSTIDWTLEDGARIPIEERSPEEVTHVGGIRIAPEGSTAYNPAFDVTPSDLVTTMITERGRCSPAGLRALYAK